MLSEQQRSVFFKFATNQKKNRSTQNTHLQITGIKKAKFYKIEDAIFC